MGAITKEEQKRRAELLAKGLKVCNKCERVLPVEQFSKDKSKKDGLNNKCKECDKQYYEENKEERQQYMQEHKEQRQQYMQQYMQEHKEKKQQYDKQYNQEHKKEKQQYYQKNKEKLQQYNNRYYQENKEQILQYQNQYYQTPQGQIVSFNANAKRRKRKEEQGAGINKDQWLEMMHFFNWKCAYSGKSLGVKNNRSIDHITPLAKGGEHEVWNCVPMDKSLNISKQDKDMMEWYTAQDFYSKERLDKILAWQQYAYNKYGKQEEVM